MAMIMFVCVVMRLVARMAMRRVFVSMPVRVPVRMAVRVTVAVIMSAVQRKPQNNINHHPHRSREEHNAPVNRNGIPYALYGLPYQEGGKDPDEKCGQDSADDLRTVETIRVAYIGPLLLSESGAVSIDLYATYV